MLKVYFSRGYSAFMAAGGCIVLICCIFALLRGGALPMAARLGFLVIGITMAWGTVSAIRLLRNPPLLFSADRRGVTMKYDPRNNSFSGPEVFLPWANVRGLELKEIRVSGYASTRAKTWVVACVLEGEVPPAVAERAVPNSGGAGNAIYLDAFDGTVKKEELLDRLRQLWQTSGKAGTRD